MILFFKDPLQEGFRNIYGEISGNQHLFLYPSEIHKSLYFCYIEFVNLKKLKFGPV